MMNEVTRINVRSEDRLVLAPQERGGLAGEAPQHESVASITSHSRLTSPGLGVYVRNGTFTRSGVARGLPIAPGSGHNDR